MYGIRQCNRISLSGEIGAFFTEIFFQISVVILNSNLHYQIFKFVIDNSDITSLNCLQHIQKRRNFDAKVTCHQPICLLLHAILSGVGVARSGTCHSWHKPISIIINHKTTIPSLISMLGDFSLSQNGQPILAQPNFHTLNKSGQCSPKNKLFSDFWVSYDR